ncbi:rab family member [Naegleria gruberi]|uniref:Rab family member n=1 Tax=Naegleria gruberi TaxID=5762 RepID=D2VST8_NAEGR|nr:rab family member [Naegleria gruberi]EFC40254.1 rab family member [Naegleria gruberi]|eukprot:XP_002672998.1 rab family member [Naegleria gruberi strain NEG-M]
MEDDGTGSESTKANFLSPLYRELPLEIIKECFSFLDMIEIVLSIGFVCSEWRNTFAWPLISHHMKECWLYDCIHDDANEQVNSFDDLFGKRLGRNCLRYMMRNFVFNLAQQVMRKHDASEKGIFKLDSRDYLEYSQLLKLYFSKFNIPFTLISQAKYQRSEILGLECNDPTVQSIRISKKKNPKYEKNLFTHKALILGKQKTGKTNFLNSFSEVPFSDNPPYEEHSFKTKFLNFGEMFRVKSQIWEWNDKIFYYCPQLFDPLSAIFITFDITNRSSFDSIIQGLLAYRDNRKKYAEVVVIGLKSDLRDSNSVTRQEVERVLIQQLLFEGSYYIEVSSKYRTNIDSAMWFTSLLVSSIHLFTNIPPPTSSAP